jgi:chemotaxis protein CheX
LGTHELVGYFVDATKRVVEMMAFLKAEAGVPHSKDRGAPSGDVTGVIGITGASHTGSVAVSFSEECIKGLVSNMLGEEVTELGPELFDAVGELTNMISGAARADLSKQGIEFEAGIPAVVCGHAHLVSHASDVSVTVIPFSTERGAFSVEACFAASRPQPELSR